jgi:hypothetical protein
MWQHSSTVVQSHSLRFLDFSSFHMGRLRHTAPSLRLFVPNSLMMCHLSFRGCACNVSFPWLCSFGSNDSPTATTAPSLDQLILNGSLIHYQQVRVITVIKIFLLSSQSLCQHNHPNFSPFSRLFSLHNHPKSPSFSVGGQCSYITSSRST